MFQKAVLVVIVYAVFNLAALYASSDSIHDQKLAVLEKCLNDLNTAVEKDKICHNVTDFKNEIKSFKDYLSKTHRNVTINENREYIKTIIAALTDKDYKHITKNVHTINNSKVKECETDRYEVLENVTLKKRLFNRNHEITPKRNTCHDAKAIYACYLKNVFSESDNITIAYFKKIMDQQLEKCLPILNKVNNSNGGSASGLKTTLGSIFMTLFTVLFL